MSATRRFVGVVAFTAAVLIGSEAGAHCCGVNTSAYELSDAWDQITVRLHMGCCNDCGFFTCDISHSWVGPNELQIDWYVWDDSLAGGYCSTVVFDLFEEFILILPPGNYLLTTNLYFTDPRLACKEGILSDQDEMVLCVDGDCNENGVRDCDEIYLGFSDDCTGNGIPDECEPDCNANGMADSCDIANGTSADCTGNGIPDECEPDCNDNGIADNCDIANGTSLDDNGNCIPDECDPNVPAASQWGLAILGLLLLAVAKIHFRQRERFNAH